LLELFAFLEQELGIQMAYRQLPPRASDQLVFTADISRAQRMLGWKPRVSAPEGLRNVLNWVQTTLLEEVA
jgi:CDP-paratose 2-epimerase